MVLVGGLIGASKGRQRLRETTQKNGKSQMAVIAAAVIRMNGRGFDVKLYLGLVGRGNVRPAARLPIGGRTAVEKNEMVATMVVMDEGSVVWRQRKGESRGLLFGQGPMGESAETGDRFVRA